MLHSSDTGSIVWRLGLREISVVGQAIVDYLSSAVHKRKNCQEPTLVRERIVQLAASSGC
jgi:hypothetical protein